MAIIGEATVVFKGKDEISSDLKKSLGGISAATNEAAEKASRPFAEKFKNVGDKVSGFGDSMSKKITLPFVAGAAAAIGFGLKTAGSLEQASIGFTTMLGSAQAADKMIKDLQKFAASTPFEFGGLVKSSQQLLAMGFQAKDIIPTMTAAGNAVAAMGGTEENVAAVTRALGQMQSKGKAAGGEMMQLTEQGIPAWQMLADKMGMTVPEVQKAVEKGMVSATTAIDAVVEGSNKRFGGMMEKQSKTLQGQMSNLQDTISQNLGAALADSMPKITALVSELTTQMGPMIQSLVPVFEGVVDAVLPLIDILMDLMEMFTSASPGMQDFIIKAGLLIVALGPITSVGGRVVSTIGDIGTAASQTAKTVSGFSAGIAGNAEKIAQFDKGAGKAGANVGKAFKSMGTSIANAGKGVMNFVKSGRIAQALTKVWTGIQAAFNIVMSLNPIMLVVIAVAALAAAFVIAYMKIKPFRELVQNIAKAITDFLIKAFEAVKKAFTSFVTAFQNVWTVIVNIVKRYGVLILAAVLPIIGIPILIMRNWSTIVGFFQRIFASVAGLARGLWNAVTGFFTRLWQDIVRIVTAIWTSYVNVWRNILTFGLNIARSIWTGISGFFRNLYSSISGVIGSIWTRISGTFSNIASNMRTNISGAVSSVVSFFTGLPGRIVNGIRNMGSTIANSINLSTVKTKITGFFTGAASWLVSAGSNIIKGLISGITNAVMGPLKNAVSGIASKVKSWKGPADYDANLLVGAGGLIMGGLIKGIEGQMGPLKNTLGGVTSTIAGTSAALNAGVAGGVGGRVVNLFPDSTVVMTGAADPDLIVRRLETMVAGSRL